jgi:hypothetical protein
MALCERFNCFLDSKTLLPERPDKKKEVIHHNFIVVEIVNVVSCKTKQILLEEIK